MMPEARVRYHQNCGFTAHHTGGSSRCPEIGGQHTSSTTGRGDSDTTEPVTVEVGEDAEVPPLKAAVACTSAYQPAGAITVTAARSVVEQWRCRVDLVVPLDTVQHPSAGTGARCRHASRIDRERTDDAVGRVGVFDVHQPARLVDRLPGHRHVAADLDERSRDAMSKEACDSEIGCEPLADTSWIEREPRGDHD